MRAVCVLAYMAGIFLLSYLTGNLVDFWGITDTLVYLAHVPLYAGLGGLLYWALLKQETMLRVAYAFTLGTLFAACDEVHQHFVPGQTFSKSDIDMDLLGVAIGIIVVILFPKVKALTGGKQ